MREDLEKYIVKHLADGTPIYLFDHPITKADSSSGSQYAVEYGKRGIDYDAGERKAGLRTDNERERIHYRVSVPCVGCCNCVVLQEYENGKYVNASYYCWLNRMGCERFGTCDNGREGKLGPHVIKRNLTMEEIVANRGKLVN